MLFEVYINGVMIGAYSKEWCEANCDKFGFMGLDVSTEVVMCNDPALD